MVEYKKKQFIAVSAVWFERFLECSRTHGTQEFPKSVWRFYHSLLNLGENELAIKDIIQDYTNNVWYPKLVKDFEDDCERNNVSLDLDYDMSNRRLVYKSNEQKNIINLFEYMIQVIQDSGVGWPTFSSSDEAWDYKDAITD